MMLELHNVTIGQRISRLSLVVEDGGLVTLSGPQGAGKTTLLRAVLGFLPVDGGHISIDGELLTPRSARYFRRQTAYVPQQLSLPEDYHPADGVLSRWTALTADERYLQLLTAATGAGKPLLIVDEPPTPLSPDAETMVDNMLRDASQRGITVLAVNNRIQQNQIQL